MMTCIYTGWEYGIAHKDDKIQFRREPIVQQELFSRYIHVEYDREKTEKVIRSICNKISYDAYMCVYYACMSKTDTLDCIYRFLRIGFSRGADVVNMLNQKDVMSIFEIRRKVMREEAAFREFTRFDLVENNFYISHIEPDNDVTYLTARYFMDRMPSENFMIIDDNRGFAAVHPKNSDIYIRYLTKDELGIFKETEKQDEFSTLWKEYFNSIVISERKNPECQRNNLPYYRRKHMTEFKNNEQISESSL